MEPRLIYLFVFAVLMFTALYLHKKYCLICDASTSTPKPYSYSRLQLLWWTFIVLTSFISTIIASGIIPTFDRSTLILIGIGTLTTASARITDISDDMSYKVAVQIDPATPMLSKDQPSNGFWLDILSDKTGVSIHRLQALIFNLVFGSWFIYQSLVHLKSISTTSSQKLIDAVMPQISDNNLILLGVSAGTYVALKTTENK